MSWVFPAGPLGFGFLDGIGVWGMGRSLKLALPPMPPAGKQAGKQPSKQPGLKGECHHVHSYRNLQSDGESSAQW